MALEPGDEGLGNIRPDEVVALEPGDEGLGNIRPDNQVQWAEHPESGMKHGSIPETGPRSQPEGLIWTIGHGTRATDGLAALLTAAGAATVIDVRRYPTGRRQPRFARERLEVDLPALGISYEWWGEALGGRRPMPVASTTESPWRSHGFIAYAAYMRSDAFRTALAALEARARAGEALAVMCAETRWWRCHRRLIADALVFDGFAVRHLIDEPPGMVHEISAASAVMMGRT
jgi:uncharacterized protein (DUF488 family)